MKTSSQRNEPGKRFCFFKFMLAFMMLTGLSSIACQPGYWSENSVVYATPTPFHPSEAITVPGLVLDKPERIVQAFLTDVQEAPDQLGGYMSSAMQRNYPRDEVIAELELPGNIDGFAIQAAEVSPSMALGQVYVQVNSGNIVLQYRFILIIENGNWVINSIENR